MKEEGAERGEVDESDEYERLRSGKLLLRFLDVSLILLRTMTNGIGNSAGTLPGLMLGMLLVV